MDPYSSESLAESRSCTRARDWVGNASYVLQEMIQGSHMTCNRRRSPTAWFFSSLLTALALSLLSSSCKPGEPEQVVENREVTTACGRCVFGMAEATVGCPWAVEIDGRRYMVQGRVPEAHENHAPDGICNMPRRALVDGRIRGNRFIASRFELKPARNVPAKPRFTPDDEH